MNANELNGVNFTPPRSIVSFSACAGSSFENNIAAAVVVAVVKDVRIDLRVFSTA